MYDECTEYTIELMDAIGQGYINRAETIQEWHMMPRENNNWFAHPNPLIAAGMIMEPLFLAENQRTRVAFLQWADELAAKAELMSQAMMDYTNDVLVPKAMERHNKLRNLQDDMEEPMSRGDFLRSFGLLKGRPAQTYI